MSKVDRINVYKNHINRIERRIQYLQLQSRRFSWYRFFIIATGLSIAIYLFYQESHTNWVVFSLFVTILIFAVIVYYHRRIHDWIKTFEIWKEIKSDQLARLTLDWDSIPWPTTSPDRNSTPFEIDLDISGRNSLLHLIDLSVSIEGSNCLLDWLTQSKPNLKHLDKYQDIVRDLVPLTQFREKLLLKLKLFSDRNLDGEKLLTWLHIPIRKKLIKWLLLLFSTLIILNIILFILHNFDILPAYWIFTTTIYITIYLGALNTIKPLLETIILMDDELEKFKRILIYLENYPYGHHQYIKQFCAPFLDTNNRPSKQIRRIKFTTSAIGLRSNPIMGFLLNLVFPWDMFFALQINNCREQLIDQLPIWLGKWSELEALLSLSNFAKLNPEYCFPEIRKFNRLEGEEQNSVFVATDLGHPLIPPQEKVCNNFKLQMPGEIIIITGSNMAGKSTFVKTLGINLCLAYAGGPVNAAYLETIPFQLHTCIKISDSITNGFSYFYAEVKCLKALLVKLNSDEHFPLLYLIDEIFRGTNNQERLIGSQAYIQNLVGKNGIGVIATHDLELANLANTNNSIYNYHFRDDVADGKLTFDYIIRPGSSPTTNALKIMEMEGLPVNPDG
jgi:ABC-type multidrug transport system fused ATPase/permease subunit